jgi:hypothetical protein
MWDFFTVLLIKIAVSRNMKSCWMVIFYQCFRVAYCPLLQGRWRRLPWGWRKQVVLKCWLQIANEQGVIFQMTVFMCNFCSDDIFIEWKNQHGNHVKVFFHFQFHGDDKCTTAVKNVKFWCCMSCYVRIQRENCRYFHLHNSFWQDSNCLFMSFSMFWPLHSHLQAIQMNGLKMNV